jgi:hypothetical protein
VKKEAKNTTVKMWDLGLCFWDFFDAMAGKIHALDRLDCVIPSAGAGVFFITPLPNGEDMVLMCNAMATQWLAVQVSPRIATDGGEIRSNDTPRRLQ